jgi:hypothetical protein
MLPDPVVVVEEPLADDVSPQSRQAPIARQSSPLPS